MKIVKRGIDVSEHQGAIDWQAVKNAGIEFAILRAGYGRTGRDRHFLYNIQECNRLQIPVGVYWFSYALTAADARREAEACIQMIRPYRVEYPVCYDLEYDSLRYAKEQGTPISPAAATAMAKAFCSKVEERGYYAMNYTNSDYLHNMFQMSQLAPFDLWFAYYQKECNRDGVGLWQYSSNGRVPGITGPCDMDYAAQDYQKLIRSAGRNRLDAARPEPTEPLEKEFQVDVAYRVRTPTHGWLLPVVNLNDYAGYPGEPITGIAIRVSKGKVKYRAHVMDGRWLPYVEDYNIESYLDGYAGNGMPIDAVEITYCTPDEITPKKHAKYRAAPAGGAYYSWQLDSQTTGSQEGFAGSFGSLMERLQIIVE